MKKLLLLLSAITMACVMLIVSSSAVQAKGESDLTKQQITQKVVPPVQTLHSTDVTATLISTPTIESDMLVGTKFKEKSSVTFNERPSNYWMITTPSGSNLTSTNCLQATKFTTDPQTVFAWYDCMMIKMTTTGLKDGMIAVDTGISLNTATTLTNVTTNVMNPLDGIIDFAMMRPEQATNSSNTVYTSWMNFAYDAGAFSPTYT